MISYTPIDLPIQLPDEDELYDYCVSNTLSKTPNLDNGIICIVGCKEDLGDWRAIIDCYEGRIYDDETAHMWAEHYDKLFNATNSVDNVGQLYFEPKFKNKFPTLVDACLKLPFKFITGIHLLLAGNKGTHLHKDPPPMQDDPLQKTSIVPNRYNISLNCFDEPRFFVQRPDGTDKTYMKVTREYPCFAFNNEDYLHGADIPGQPNERRMQLLIYGILDNDKHQEVLSRSVEKFYG